MYALEKRDLNRIAKLNTLTDLETFWQDVRKLCKNCTSDHAIRAWQRLAEQRYTQLNYNQTNEQEN